jgi:hypothetical protein
MLYNLLLYKNYKRLTLQETYFTRDLLYKNYKRLTENYKRLTIYKRLTALQEFTNSELILRLRFTTPAW